MPVFKSYGNLVQRLQKQCDIYKRLDEKAGDIGNHLYSEVQTGPGNPAKSVPDEPISEYLRGGIISSFAEYEAFLHEVLYEMVDMIYSEPLANAEILSSMRDRRRRSAIPGTDEDWCKTSISSSLNNPRWCTFQAKFNKIFCCEVHSQQIPNLELLYGENFSFCYPLTGDKYSKITDLTEKDVTYILDLWYGMRCVGAHGGMLIKALNRVQLPNAEANPCQAINDGYDFSKFLKDNLKHPDPDNSLSHYEFRLISSIPGKSFIKTNLRTSGDLAIKRVDKYFSDLDLDDSAASTSELSRGYGLYHIGRLSYFTCDLKKEMYITYRMFVRVNQFLLLLSFRIHLALRKWLHEYSKLKNISIYLDEDLITNFGEEIRERHDEQEVKIKKLIS